MKKCLIYIICLFSFARSVYSQFNINAGSDRTVCINTSSALGGTPTVVGGTPPYKYEWSPSTFLNSTSVANPIASGINADIMYKLTVTDADTNIVIDYVLLTLDKIHTFNAGIDTGYCYGLEGGPQIGAQNNTNTSHSFNWSPGFGLNDSLAANPIATPSITTIYTLTVSDVFCPDNITQVTVSAFGPPVTNAGRDTIIDEGSTITLNGTGGIVFWWNPDYNIKYRSSNQPDVWPITTTTYYLWTSDQHGCTNQDDVTIEVRNGNTLFFYSAFTPNNDGDNDFFYIGNVEKFPENSLKVYNRYGKLIYSATNYVNTWDGTYLGTEVPTGTYFYIFDDGKNQKHKGTVTIMR